MNILWTDATSIKFYYILGTAGGSTSKEFQLSPLPYLVIQMFPYILKLPKIKLVLNICKLFGKNLS